MTEPIIVVEPKGHGSRPFARLSAERVRSRADVVDALERFQRGVWIAPTAPAVDLLLTAPAERSRGEQRVLIFEAKGARHGLLHALFRFVVAPDEGIRLLPLDELAEVLGSPEREDLFIGGGVDEQAGAAVLYRGTLEPLVVPLTSFPARRGGPKPDPSALEVTDFGHTVRLGEYEAATDAILYEVDEGFRRRAKKRLLHEDRSWGGALRRLRIQKGLGRGDFAGISAKEIARLERGEVKRPHPGTMASLAKRLGVRPEKIATF